MSWQVVVRKAAEIEIAEATTWYEGQRPRLGRQFVESVERALVEIAERPEAWPLWIAKRPYRKFVLSRFPFTIFYKVEGATLVVVAVAHSRRKPGYWMRRER